MANFNKMIRQAQKMREEMEKAQNEVAKKEITYASNGVEVTVTGEFNITKLTINPDLIAEQDKEMLEDLVMTTVNGAISQAREEVEERMSAITGGLNIPGLM